MKRGGHVVEISLSTMDMMIILCFGYSKRQVFKENRLRNP